MKMANNRHRNEKLQTYSALALIWFLIVTFAIPVAGSILLLVSEMTVAAMAASPSIPTNISFILPYSISFR